jgi:hypothetical protein
MTSKTIRSNADHQAVLGVLKGVYEAWEANDAEAFVADYLDDASVVQPGVYMRGPAGDPEQHGRWVRRPAQGIAGDRPTPRRPVPQRGHGHRDQRGRDRFSRTERRAERGHGPGHVGAGQTGRPLVCRGVPLQRRELGIGIRGGFPGSVGSRLVPWWAVRIELQSRAGFGRNALSSWHSLDRLVDVRCPRSRGRKF